MRHDVPTLTCQTCTSPDDLGMIGDRLSCAACAEPPPLTGEHLWMRLLGLDREPRAALDPRNPWAGGAR